MQKELVVVVKVFQFKTLDKANNIRYSIRTTSKKGYKMSFEREEDLLTKDEHIINFIKSFVALEEAMQPFKDQLKDLRGSYVENDWLSKADMRMAVKVYRMLKQGDDIEMVKDFFDQLKNHVEGPDEY